MRIRIDQGTPVGETAAPPSKSYGHRVLICAALAGYCAGTRGSKDNGAQSGYEPDPITSADTIISGMGDDGEISEDILATADCIRVLGIGCGISDGVARVGQSGSDTGMLPVLPCRESGSTLRFFIPIAMTLAGGGMFTGSGRLMQRGIEVYEELFASQSQNRDGTDAITVTKGLKQITVEGRLKPGEMTVRGDVSSQFISGLLYALPLLDGDSILHVAQPIESRLYIDITIDVMKSFGVMVEEPVQGTFHIPGRQHYKPGDKTVEGDWSNAAFLYAMKYLHENRTLGAGYAAECDGTLYTGAAGYRDTRHSGTDAFPGSLRINGLNPDSLQGDRICLEYFRRLDAGDTPPIDLTGCPDLGPVLFAYAAARGGGRFTGVRRLRIKESDRVACMQEELEKFGIETQSTENELMIYPGVLHAPCEVLNGHNDHRIVMALAVLCTLTGGTIEGAEAVRKSWPDFWRTMGRIGITTAEV